MTTTPQTIASWLATATRCLAAEPAARVRQEITAHYEDALTAGATAEKALAALGDPQAANRQYRRVLLTASQARLLAGSEWEARLVCTGRRWLRLLPLIPAAAALGGWFAGWQMVARMGLAAAIVLSCFLTAPLLLPVYTPVRARIFRAVRGLCLVASLLIAAGPARTDASWMFAACAWPFVWMETERAAIRRKLPAAAWPRQLYL